MVEFLKWKIRYHRQWSDKYIKIVWVIFFIGFMTIWVTYEELDEFDTLYLFHVLISTMGLGDISPKTQEGKLTIIVFTILLLTTLHYLFTRTKKMRTEIPEGTELIVYCESPKRLQSLETIFSTFKSKKIAIVVSTESVFARSIDLIEQYENRLMVNGNLVSFVVTDDLLSVTPKSLDGGTIVLSLCNPTSKEIDSDVYRGVAICSTYEAINPNVRTVVEVREFKEYMDSLKSVDTFVTWNQGKFTSLVLHNVVPELDQKIYEKLVKTA